MYVEKYVVLASLLIRQRYQETLEFNSANQIDARAHQQKPQIVYFNKTDQSELFCVLLCALSVCCVVIICFV
jgi:hypothetical protein